MAIEIFAGAVKSLHDLAKAIFALKDIPGKERDKYRALLHDTFTLLDSAILLVINKLSDLLILADTDRDRFLLGLKSLDNIPEWEKLARDVRLCHPLRAASSELDRIIWNFQDQLILKDHAAVSHLISDVLDREGQLAWFISESLKTVASRAAELTSPNADFISTKELMQEFKLALNKERDALIRAEISSFDVI